MTAFRFEALNAQGHTEQGIAHADSARAARSQLRQQGLTPLEVTPLAHSDEAKREGAVHARTLKTQERALLTRQLAGLVAADLPLEKALAALVDDLPKPAQRDTLSHVRAEVQAGASLASALGQHPKDFPDDYCAVVGAGEQSGQLGAVLERLAQEMEASEQLRSKLLGAALYPAIVSAVAVVMVVFLMSFVVPQVASVFAAREQGLPWLTRAMLALSAFTRDYGLWLGLAMALGLVGARALYAQAEWRLRMDAAWLRLPGVGGMIRDYQNARLAATLGLLNGAGLPILKALQTAANTMGNHAMRRDVSAALDLVREGASLAAALDAQPCITRWLVVFARLGEQTGQLSTMLERAAQQTSDRVQRKAMATATILEPLLILAMGLIVLTIVLSVLMPIMELNQLAGT